VPQLSQLETAPQFLPLLAQNVMSVSWVHAQVFAPVHVSGATHAPHETTVRVAPQLSFAVTAPQLLPSLTQNS
jgi:hypothetical protein